MQNNFDNAVEIGEEIVGVDLNDVKWDDPAPETKNNAVEIGEEIPDADLSKVQWDAPSDAQSAMEGKPEPRRPIPASLVRRSFTGDDGFAFIDDADVKSAFIQTIRLADDPDAEMKKWAVAAHLTKNDRRQIGYIVGNIDNACKIYFGKKTSVEQAYNQIRESYMPKAPEPAPTPDQILDRAVHNVPHGDLSAIPKELALGIFNRIMMLKWAHWDLPAEDILEEKALAKRDAALDKSRQKYHAQSESQWRKLFGVDQVKVADDPLTGREIFQDIDEARKFRIEGPFSKTPPLIDRLGVAVPPVEPKWNVDFGSQKAEADNAEMEKNYMAYVRKFPELYSYAKDAETAADVQRAYRMEVEKRFAEKNGEQAFAEVKTQADTAQKNSDLAFESRNREAVHIYQQEGRSGLRQQIISEKKHLDQLFAENEKKYHSGKSLGENWKSGDAVGLVHEALAICFDQVAKSIVPMAIENAAANAVLPGSGIAKMVSGALFWHDMFAEGTVQAIENDPEISDADRRSYARTYAALEVIPEYLFGWFKIFDKFHVSNEVRKGFWNGVLDFGKTGAEDTFGEVITFIGEKILDADAGYGTPGGKKAAEMSAEEFKEFFLDGLPETVVGSFFTAGIGDTASHFARHAAEEKYRGQLAQRIEELEKTEARTDVQERELDLLRNAVHSDDMTEVAAALAVSQVLRQKKGITPDQARDTLSPEDRAAQAIRDNGVRNAIHFDANDTVREVEVVKDLLHLNDRSRINAVKTFDALPDVVKQDIQKKKLSPDAVDAYYYDGKCYIIADRVNPAKVFSRVLHEYVTHFGLRQTLGEAQFNDFMDLVFEEHADEITGSPLAESYGFDPDAEMPENARLTKQRELAEEWLARKAEEIAPLLRRGIENAEVGRWRKFIGRIRRFLAEHRLLPKSYLDRLDDRTLTDLLRRTLGNAGYELDAVREDSGNFENSGNDGRSGDGRAAMRSQSGNKGKQAYYEVPFLDGLKEIVDPSQKEKRNAVFVSNTPPIFEKIGFTALPMMTNARHLRLNYYTRKEFESIYGPMRQGEHAHGLHDALQKLPKALEHPLAIVVNLTPNAKPGSVVAITDISVNGKKVVVPVLIETESTVNGERIDSHLVLTVYDSENWIDAFLVPAVKEEKRGVGIFYFDDKKASRYSALSKKKGSIPTGFVHNITEAGINVKPQTETLQFKRWFGKSKVVDANGKPLVVYHGSDADFFVFDMDKSRANMDIRGAFFSPWEDDARGYGKNVRAFYLSIQNPASEAEAYKALNMFKGENNAGVKARDYLIGKGYDGVNVAGEEYIAFYPEQIKSATDNVGTFDPNNPDVRFSVDPAAHLDPTLEDNMIEALLLPVKKANGELSALLDGGALKYLTDNGFPDVGNVTARYLTMEAKARLKAIYDRRARAAAFQNYRDMDPLFDFIVEFAGGGENVIVNPGKKYVDSDVSGSFISPAWKKHAVKRPQGAKESDASYKKYLAKREAALAKAEGVNLDEIARAYVRQFGGDEAEIEQKMFDLLKDLKKKDISNIYATYKKDHLAYEKKLNEEAEAEFRALKEQQAKDDAAKMLSDGGEITPEFIKAHRDVVDEIYRQLLGKEPPEKIGKKDLAALNAALMAEGTDTKSTFAQAYKVAAEKAYYQFAEKLRELRDAEAKDDAAINALQQKAMDFAEKNLPKEHRGDFIRQIVALAKMSDANGKRSEAFEKLLQKMVDTAAEARKADEISRIRQIFADNKIVRKGKGIPESKIPSVQNDVNELRKIFRLPPGAVDAYRNARISVMMNNSPESDAYLRAQKELAMSYLFGDLANRTAQNAAEAREYLEDLVNGAQKEYKNRLAEKLEKIQKIRTEVIRQNGGESIDTKAKVDAKKLSEFLLKNRASIDSFLLLASGADMGKFDKTWEADIARRVFEGEEAQATFERTLDAEFREAANRLCGVALSRFGWQKFINSLNEVVEHSGVFRYVYETEIKQNGEIIKLDGKRPAIRTHIPWEIAAEAFGREGDAITGFYRFSGKDALQKRAEITALLKQHGIDSDLFAVFAVEQIENREPRINANEHESGTTQVEVSPGSGETNGGKTQKSVAHIYAIENGAVRMIEAPIADIPGSVTKLSPEARRFAEKQTADIEAGVEPTHVSDKGEFVDKVDAGAAALLDENARRAASVQLLGELDNPTVRREEMTNLTRDEALQLILEWEQDFYKDNFVWNGFTEETIQQLYDFVGKDLLALGHWMRGKFAESRPALNKIALEKFGAELPQQENYWPGVFTPAAAKQNALERQAGQMSMNPNFLIGRRGHLKAPDAYVGAVAKFLDQMQSQAYFVNMQGVVGELNEVFGDYKVRQSLRQRLGNNIVAEIDRRISELAHGGSTEKGYVGRLANAIMKFEAVSKLGLSFPSMLKQAAGSAAYMYDIGVGDFCKYSAMAYGRSKKFRDFCKMAVASDYFKNRQAGGLSPDVRFLMNASLDSGNYSTLTAAMIDLGMKPIQWGDAFATLYGGFTVYQSTYDNAIKDGVSPQEAKEKALYKWMKATDETQQSSKLSMKNYFMITPGFHRMMTMFMSNSIQTMDLVLQSIDEVRFSGGTEARRKLARRLLVSHVIVPALMTAIGQAWRHGFDIDEWDWKEFLIAHLFGSFEGVFLAKAISATAEKIISMYEGKYVLGGNSVRLAPVDNAEHIARSVKKILGDKELTPSDYADAVQSFGELMQYGGYKVSTVGDAGSLISAIGLRAKQILKWKDGKKEPKIKFKLR